MDISREERKVLREVVGDFLKATHLAWRRDDFSNAMGRKLNILKIPLGQLNSRGYPKSEISDFQEEVLFEVLCFDLDRLTLMEIYGDLSRHGKDKLSEKRKIMERLLHSLQGSEKHSRLQFVARTIFLAPAELVRMGLIGLIAESVRLRLLDRYRHDNGKGRLALISQFYYLRLTSETH